jgi:hypothetical protein
MAKSAKWTFMVYMAGDNNLSAAGDNDLGEMRKVGSTADVNVLVQFDNAGNKGTRRFRVLKGGKDLVQSLNETDCGDPNVLLDYIKWARENYPAERYALILWNHGGGWEPSDIDTIAQDVRAMGYGSRESVERSSSPLGRAFFRPTWKRILGLSNAQERAICSDDGSGHSLDTIELGKVLEKTSGLLGKKLDLLGMDACLMSNLEVAYQAQPYVEYIVASEESEPNEGWPYDALLPLLVNNPGLKTAAFASHIVRAYCQSYIDMGNPNDVTQAALDLARMGDLNTALDHLAEELYVKLPRGANQIWTAQYKSKSFWHSTLFDIGSFSSQIKRATRTVPVKKAADEVAAALKTGQGQFVMAEAHHGAGVTACSGVTIYLPSPLSGMSRFYKDLEFAQKQKWLKLLKAYIKK